MFRLVNKGHHKFSFVGSINLLTMHSTFLYEEGLHMVAGCEQFGHRNHALVGHCYTGCFRKNATHEIRVHVLSNDMQFGYVSGIIYHSIDILVSIWTI